MVWWDGAVPSLRHEILARGMPRLRKSSELDDEERERSRLEQCQGELDLALPTNAVIGFERRYEVETSEIGDDVRFPVHTLRRRGSSPRRTVLYLHGGGFVAPLDPFHVRYAAALASELDADVVLPDYPLAPTYSGASSSRTPHPGCQRRRAAGRWE